MYLFAYIYLYRGTCYCSPNRCTQNSTLNSPH